MPSLFKRVAFLWRAPRWYSWHLLLRKLGVRRVQTERDGKTFVVPLSSPGGVQLVRPFESWWGPLLRQLLPATTGTFVDVGANVGQTLLWLRSVDEDRPWLGFEPSENSCRTVRALIECNSFRNTELIEAGLSDAAGSGVLYAGGGTDSSATMIRDFSGKLASQQELAMQVRLLCAAELMDQQFAAQVGIVKIDVEGMELEVLRGLKPVFERDRPILIVEVIPTPDDGSERSRRMLQRQEDLTSYVHSMRYRLAQIHPDARLMDVDAPRNDVGLEWSNYCAIPNERYEEIRALFG